jgi:energy-coupling factor transporter ATP-binding protein EcfA2
MNSLVKKLINAIGFDIRRHPAVKNEPIRSCKTRNTIIELIGPSGIGKTTLLKMVSKHLRYPWNLSYTTDKRKISKASKKLDDLYHKILFRKISSLYEQEKEVDRFAKLSAFFIKRMLEDRHLKYSEILDNGGWFLDDGFCHSFTAEILQLLGNKECDDEAFMFLFENRNFILLNAPVDRIVDNLKNRQLNNKESGNDYMTYYGDEGIEMFLQESIKNKRKLIDHSVQYGARCYTISMVQTEREIISIVRDIEFEVITKK